MIKKLFEKQIVHHSFVLAMVALACGLVIGGVNHFTSSIIEKNLDKAKTLAFESVMQGLDSFEIVEIEGLPISIQEVVRGYDENEDALGYIYEVFKTNKFGHLRIVVSIDENGTILGAQFLELKQTLNLTATESNLDKFIGTQIKDLEPKGDLISGVTVSSQTLLELLADIAVAHDSVAVLSANSNNTIDKINYFLADIIRNDRLLNYLYIGGDLR